MSSKKDKKKKVISELRSFAHEVKKIEIIQFSTGTQGYYYNARLHGYNVANLQGCKATKSQGYKIWTFETLCMIKIQ